MNSIKALDAIRNEASFLKEIKIKGQRDFYTQLFHELSYKDKSWFETHPNLTLVACRLLSPRLKTDGHTLYTMKSLKAKIKSAYLISGDDRLYESSFHLQKGIKPLTIREIRPGFLERIVRFFASFFSHSEETKRRIELSGIFNIKSIYDLGSDNLNLFQTYFTEYLDSNFCHDNILEEEIINPIRDAISDLRESPKVLAEKIADGELTMVPCYLDKHLTMVIFSKNNVIKVNLGLGAEKKPGLLIYTYDPSTIKFEDLSTTIQGLQSKEGKSYYDNLNKHLNLTYSRWIPRTPQLLENCWWVTPTQAFFGALYIELFRYYIKDDYPHEKALIGASNQYDLAITSVRDKAKKTYLKESKHPHQALLNTIKVKKLCQ